MSQPWLGNGFNPMLLVAIAHSCSLVVLAWVYFQLEYGFTPSPYLENAPRPNTQSELDHKSLAEPLDSALQLWRQQSAEPPNAERFFNLSLDMLMISNIDGYATQINPAWERILGLRLEELKAQPWISFVHPQDVEATQAQMEQLKKGVCITRFENRYRRQDGSYTWLSWTAVPFLEEGLIYGVARDIGDYKQAEEALRKVNQELETAIAERLTQLMHTSENLLTEIAERQQREQQLRAIFEQSLDAITITDNLGIYQEANPAACKLFGLPLNELLGKRIVDFMEPGFDVEPMWSSFRKQGQLTGTMHLLRLDGTVRHVDYAAKANFLPGRDLSILRDITDRKQAELALLEERNFISAILETVNALIAVLDAQGRFVRFNRACEQITGYSLEEVQGKYIWDLFLMPEEIEQVKSMIQELQLGQFPNESEHYWLTQDGSRHLISWFNTVILDTDGSIKHIISIGIDITDRKRAEDMRRELEREQALSELRLRFFSMASHEFRTPLSTILLTAQILESSAQGWSQEKRTRNLQRIVSAAREMRQMLDDILTINRAETGRLEFAPTPIEVNCFCHNMIQEMQTYATPLHTFSFSSQSETEWIWLDEKLLRYIISNLLSNAIKYSPKGGTINLEILRKQESILFQIYDQGIGILIADQPHLFEAFHRGANVESIPGSGLGLTVAKKCVELHGGRITFTSEVGVGTTFTVMIPIQMGNQ